MADLMRLMRVSRIQYLFRFYPPVTVSSSRLVSSRPSNPFPLLLFAAAVLQRLGSVVPSDSVFPEVELAEDDAVVCSRVTPDGGGEVVAWCKIRRGGDVSAATIWNLSLDAIIVDGRVIQQEAVDIKPGSEIVPGPQKDAMAASLSGLEGLQLIRVIKVRVLPVHNRSDEEIALLESYAPVKTNILIKAIYTVRCTTRQRSVPSSASTLP
uniref:Uncharacterized protein n=1 Tax=Oryza glumipatula TaxID=40148 RepID=A0A0E0AQB6_9ORYZ